MTYFESSLVDLLKRARWHTMDALVSILKIIFLNSSGRSTALIIILLVGVAVVTFFLLFIKDTSKKNATPDQTSLDHRLVTKQSFDTSVDLIPLKIGMYWEYEVTNGESKSIDRHEIYYEETINGQKWFEGGSYFFDGEYVRNSKDGVHVLVYCDYDPLPECDGDEEKSIDKILFNKTLNQGDTYQYSEATITFQGQRKVTVPAGEYICLTYKFETENSVLESCYTPGVGLVYSETKFDAKLAVYRLLSTGIESMSADDLYEYLIEDNWQPALRTYIDQGSDLNETDTNGQALLHWAAMLHNSGQVSYIISQGGIEIDKQDDRGDTPLHLATQSTMEALYSGNKPDFSTVAVLLKAGANHNLKNKYGETAVELTKGYEKDMYYKQQFEQYIK